MESPVSGLVEGSSVVLPNMGAKAPDGLPCYLDQNM